MSLFQYHFAGRGDSDIKVLDDIEGASVFLGPTGGGAWNAAYGWVKSTTGLDAKAGDYEAVDANWTTGFQAFLDGSVDVYNADLLKWVQEDLRRGYVESEFTTGKESTFERIAQSQYEVISQMAYQLLDYIDNNAEEEE